MELAQAKRQSKQQASKLSASCVQTAGHRIAAPITDEDSTPDAIALIGERQLAVVQAVRN